MTREFAVKGNQLSATKRRSGFTLIELLVVIAIIAILAGLILAAVMAFLNKGPQVQNRHDILQLSAALQNFKTKYGQYPPSRIRLYRTIASYKTPVDQLDKDSISFLQSVMFPNMSSTATIDWAGYNGANPVAIPATGIVLEEDQCLVFFLGGPPNTGGNASAGLMGFSNNAVDPVDKTNPNRIKFFEFEVGRLFNRGTTPSKFPSYYDVYGKQPIIYFSSNRRPNGYDTTANSLGVKPYLMQSGPPVKFYMPESFQLISAGADGAFGPGGFWTEANAGAIPVPGKDDVTNFHDGFMGNP
jgi:prepilin-type N-terminal cleavage/methylation domain-containing protein